MNKQTSYEKQIVNLLDEFQDFMWKSSQDVYKQLWKYRHNIDAKFVIYELGHIYSDIYMACVGYGSDFTDGVRNGWGDLKKIALFTDMAYCCRQGEVPYDIIERIKDMSEQIKEYEKSRKIK